MTSAGDGRERTSGIQVIARAAEILRALRAVPGGLSQAELADRLGLARSTTHRILAALEDEGLVTVTRTRGHYRIGPEIARLAESVRRDLVGRLHPYLQELSADLGETVDLSVLDGSRVTFLDQVVSSHRLRAVSAVGASFPAHACAPGKAMLAGLPAGRLAQVLPATFEALTPFTVTSPDALKDELARVLREGVAFDHQEHTEGVSAVAVALDLPGGPMAISVPMPSQRFEGRDAELRTALLRTAAAVRSLDG